MQQLQLALKHLNAGRWQDSAQAYRRACPPEALPLLPVPEQLRRNLALNLAEAETSRPALFHALVTAPADSRFRIETTPSGRPTITFRDAGGRARPLGEGPDPLAYLAALRNHLKPVLDAAKCIALFGVGDGYLLTSLARHPRPQPFGRQQCVHVFEPHAGGLTLALMLHDLSGESGPFRQQRFQFYLGPDCIEQFRRHIQHDLQLPWPEAFVAFPPDGPSLQPRVQDCVDAANRQTQAQLHALRTRARSVTPDRLIDATSAAPSRQPRALLLTTRQSTVLQYSTRDLAQAFRELGWRAEVVIEPSPHHTLTIPHLIQSQLDLDPDLIVQLDHIRAEHGELFPEQVPFLCWAQDHLPNLTSRAAGRAHGPRDFFLTCLGPWFVREYDYPPDAIIPLNKLTRIPELPPSWSGDGPDMVYVSNAATPPADALAELVRYYGGNPDAARVVERAGAELAAIYAGGGSVFGCDVCRELCRRAAEALGVDSARLPAELPVDLFERVNNLHYRQQALRWAADIARRRGLSLAIYGGGWDKHPDFADFARGVVAYGPDLEALTRSARINLQVVPYSALHQRLLDGVAAGGFFLIRQHPADSALPALCRFVREHVPPEVRTLSQASARLSPPLLTRLRELAAANAYILDRMDAIELARTVPLMGLHDDDAELPPRLAEVSFASADQLEQRIDAFLSDPDLRRRIALEQREAVAGKLSYRAGLTRVLAEVHRRLLRHSAEARSAA